MSTLFHNILRAVASAMEIPVVICLLLLAFSVFSLGWWLAELLGERRHMNASLPRLLETMRSGERPLPDCIAAAAHNGKRGNPCLFPARFFPELCALEADRGGSSVIRRHEDALLLVEAGERELFDCDTKQALEILKGNA